MVFVRYADDNLVDSFHEITIQEELADPNLSRLNKLSFRKEKSV